MANCHKLPQALFEKILFENHEIIVDFQGLIEDVKSINPHLKWMFTVSPVKHLRDGVVENNLSKAILIQSVHQLVKQNTHCFYFPAYELVIDDLRDYRFFESDMAHPNTQAINTVMEAIMNEVQDKILSTLDMLVDIYGKSTPNCESVKLDEQITESELPINVRRRLNFNEENINL